MLSQDCTGLFISFIPTETCGKKIFLKSRMYEKKPKFIAFFFEPCFLHGRPFFVKKKRIIPKSNNLILIWCILWYKIFNAQLSWCLNGCSWQAIDDQKINYELFVCQLVPGPMAKVLSSSAMGKKHFRKEKPDRYHGLSFTLCLLGYSSYS